MQVQISALLKFPHIFLKNVSSKFNINSFLAIIINSSIFLWMLNVLLMKYLKLYINIYFEKIM